MGGQRSSLRSSHLRGEKRKEELDTRKAEGKTGAVASKKEKARNFLEASRKLESWDMENDKG